MKHISGAVVEIDPEKHHCTRKYVLVSHHSDQEAALVLIDFFVSGVGTHSYIHFKGAKSKDWAKHCADARQAFDKNFGFEKSVRSRSTR